MLTCHKLHRPSWGWKNVRNFLYLQWLLAAQAVSCLITSWKPAVTQDPVSGTARNHSSIKRSENSQAPLARTRWFLSSLCFLMALSWFRADPAAPAEPQRSLIQALIERDRAPLVSRAEHNRRRAEHSASQALVQAVYDLPLSTSSVSVADTHRFWHTLGRNTAGGKWAAFNRSSHDEWAIAWNKSRARLFFNNLLSVYSHLSLAWIVFKWWCWCVFFEETSPILLTWQARCWTNLLDFFHLSIWKRAVWKGEGSSKMGD